MRRFLVSAVLLGVVLAPPLLRAAVDNKLQNSGFEQAIGGANNWDNTANRGIQIISGGAPEGNTFLRLNEADTVAGGFVGVFTFQVVTGVKEGDIVAFNGLVRANALDGGDEGQLRIEFRNDAGLVTASNVSVAAVSAQFSRVFVSGTAPASVDRISFVLRIQPSNAGGGSQVDFDDMQGTINGFPVLLTAGANDSVQEAGDLTMISTRLLNVSANVLSNVELVATPSSGISIHPEHAFLDARKVGQREGSVIFGIGDLSTGQDSLFAFAVLLSSGVVPGKRYELTLFARTAGGAPLSDIARVVIDVEFDPLFHMGTILGKVFHDLNGNGVQDPGEKGIRNVRIGTEQGMVVYTDKYGRYHLPAVTPGRHVVKVDWHSLPQGTRFITEESYLVKITEGLLAKVNFAVQLPENDIPLEYQDTLVASVIQELDRIDPELAIDMDPGLLRMGEGVLERDVVFYLKTNYGPVVKDWKIEVRDEMGHEVWTGFGRGAPPVQVRWDGKDNVGNAIEPGDYALRFIVMDKLDREDWTSLRFFRVQSKKEGWNNPSRTRPFADIGYFNIAGDGKRSIPLNNLTSIRVQGKTPSKNKVVVNGVTAPVDADGFFETTLFVPHGKQRLQVTSTTEGGETLSYQRDVELKENYLFMVGLGEEELGVNNYEGDVEAVAGEDRFRDGFYQNGRVAYYLKGKIKGKVLITSAYDSEDENKRSKLFASLDPDEYYPVYGDGSEIDFAAQGTASKLYILVEMDEKSFLKWGSFNTDFTDTELASHNRTMSGGKVHFETLGTTRYGDSKKGVTGFYSVGKHQPDHNVFTGTGGSLLYLRHRRVVEGSEKVRLEVHDKITAVVLSRRDYVNGVDYEIDYAQGRIILKKPFLSTVQDNTVINQTILDGHTNVLVVDYEYEESRAPGFGTGGIRGFTHLGEFVRVGGTYVEEKRAPNELSYTLRGVDATAKVGMNTQITAEYAESENTHVQGVTSNNGGLTFGETGSVNAGFGQLRNGAYIVRIQSRPFKPFDVSAYAQKFNPFFHNADTVYSQGDFKKYGLEANYRLSANFTLRYRQDNLHLVKKNLFVANADRAKFHTAQATYDGEKMFAQAEYRHAFVKTPEALRLVDSIFSTNNFGDAVGLKLGYHVTENVMPYVRGQATFNGDNNTNNQLGVGLESHVSDKSVITVEENFGNLGDSTRIQFETKTAENTTSYASIRVGEEGLGGRGTQTTLGSSHILDDRSRIFSEKEYSEFRGDTLARNILGYERTFFDGRLGGTFTFERDNLDSARQLGTTFPGVDFNNAVSAGLTYREGDFLEASSKWDFRRASDSALAASHQWLAYNHLGIHLTKDLEFFSRFNMSKTRDLDFDDTLADFLELNAGFAFRPVEWDRFNFLSRYTHLRDNLPDSRFETGIALEEIAHILAFEGAYDLDRYFELVEKFAFKISELGSRFGGGVEVFNYLWINRVNFHVTRKWDLGLEYRLLTQQGAGENMRHGMLVELDREILDYTRVGVGYNFTDFDDDLRSSNDYESYGRGPFVRLTGKF
jgi:hypothetical protein